MQIWYKLLILRIYKDKVKQKENKCKVLLQSKAVRGRFITKSDFLQSFPTTAVRPRFVYHCWPQHWDSGMNSLIFIVSIYKWDFEIKRMPEQQPEGFGLWQGEPLEKMSVIFKNSYAEHSSLWLLRRVGKIYTIFSDIEEEMSWFKIQS